MSRAMPWSAEAEQYVLGALMAFPAAHSRVADLLTEEDFYQHNHRLIWRGVCELIRAQKPSDSVSLSDWFEMMGLASEVANGAYLIELESGAYTAAMLEAHAEIISDRAKRRRLIEVATQIVNSAFAPDGRDTAEILGDAQQAVGSIGHSKGHKLKSVNDGLTEMVDAMAQRMESGGMVGTSFGLPDLDAMTGGKQAGDLIIIAARPSMGKTTLALQGCLAAGRPLIFSFETKAEKLLARMTACVGQFPLRWILFPWEAPDHAMQRIIEATRLVKEKLSASIYDGRRLNAQQLCAIARREHAKSPVREIVIDHFGHLKLAGKGRADQEMGEGSKDFKELARDLDVPVVLLMQLNRNVESRTDKRPILADLRECGAAEEDADIVAMIYRDAVYNKASSIAEYGEIFLRKNRDGEAGEIWTKPVLSEMRFDPAEPQQRPHSGAGTSSGYTGGSPGIRTRHQSNPLAVVGGGR